MVASRIWATYVQSLKARPLQTRMVTSGILFGIGDVVAQQGFEHRGTDHDAPRTLRTAFYGTVIFAPLVHTWLGVAERITLGGTITTLLTRTTLDVFAWGSFITTVYWTSTGLLEGKTVEDVKEKVEAVFPRALFTSWSVFGPAQLVNFAVVPPIHRMLFTQVCCEPIENHRHVDSFD